MARHTPQTELMGDLVMTGVDAVVQRFGVSEAEATGLVTTVVHQVFERHAKRLVYIAELNCAPAQTSATKTPEQVRGEFSRRGESFTSWAEKHGFAPKLVHEIVRGRRKCHIGQSHRIAVALGMKAGDQSAS